MNRQERRRLERAHAAAAAGADPSDVIALQIGWAPNGEPPELLDAGARVKARLQDRYGELLTSEPEIHAYAGRDITALLDRFAIAGRDQDPDVRALAAAFESNPELRAIIATATARPIPEEPA